MHINGIVLRTLIAQLSEQLDTNALLESVGLSSRAILNDAFTLDANTFGHLLEQLVQQTGDERIGLKLGFQTPLSVLGNLGGLYQSCATLGHMLKAMQQYIGWLDGINSYAWKEDGHLVQIITTNNPVWQAKFPRAARQMIEHNIGFSLRWKREYLGKPITPLAVAVPYARIGPTDLLESYFDCPIQFDYPHMQITLPRAFLDYRAAAANERAQRIYEAEMVSFINKKPLYGWQVRQLLEAQLSADSQPTTNNLSLQFVAGQLAQSPRSLQRRLQEEGLSFQGILNEVRLELIRHYEHTDRNLTRVELAERLGFMDATSLSRFLQKNDT